APIVRPRAHLAVDFGRQDDLVAAAVLAERPPHDALALAVVIDVGGVDEIDAAVERGVDDAQRLVFGRGVAEVHGAQTERRDLHPGAAKAAVVHVILLLLHAHYRSRLLAFMRSSSRAHTSCSGSAPRSSPVRRRTAAVSL